jgi:hypothetical protein
MFDDENLILRKKIFALKFYLATLFQSTQKMKKWKDPELDPDPY